MSSDIHLRAITRSQSRDGITEPEAVHVADLRRVCTSLESNTVKSCGPEPLATLPTALDVEGSGILASHPSTEALPALPALPDDDADVFASLPPVDRGRRAWTFLAGATVMETITWGLPYSVGVLHAYWVHEMFPGSESTVTLAATLMNGMLLVAGGLFAPVLTFFAYHTTYIQLFGLACGTAALVGSAFATQAWHLVITLGFLYPMSMLMWLPCATFLYEWFHARRGLAFGILCAGAAVGGTVFPLMGEGLLQRIGYKGTMYSLGAMFGGANAASMFFVKRRIPLPSKRSGRRAQTFWPKLDYGFLKHRAVYVMGLWVLLSAMASFLPSLWMTTFAADVGAMNGTSLVAIMYACSVVGNVVTGWLVDRYQPRIVVFCACVSAGLAAWLLWGFGTSDACLIAFCIIWGLTALCSASAWGRMVAYIGKDDHTLPGLLTSLMMMLRGVGNFVSGPLSTALLSQGALKGAVAAYRSNYGAMLMFTGVVTFVGGVLGGGFPTV